MCKKNEFLNLLEANGEVNRSFNKIEEKQIAENKKKGSFSINKRERKN